MKNHDFLSKNYEISSEYIHLLRFSGQFEVALSKNHRFVL